MGSPGIIKLGILTSSRADFGIYLPLLKALKEKPEEFHFEIIAFGTHLSAFHGTTMSFIIEQGFEVTHTIPSMMLTDDEESIATGFSLTSLKFSSFWAQHKRDYDLVFCLGDRYEMAAAVSAAIPFGIRFAHIGGGETTLGAIDNVYRNYITLASDLHFVTLDSNAAKVRALAGDDAVCIAVGSLSLNNLDHIKLLSLDEFHANWAIDLRLPTILLTIHPETVNYQKNSDFCKELLGAMRSLLDDYQIIITMPNADTSGSVFRQAFEDLKAHFPEKVRLVENFGTQAYFTCMNYCEFLMGNTSSGILEAASFNKYVINIGDRQKGRQSSNNILHVPFDIKAILDAVNLIKGKSFSGTNIYKKENAVELIIQQLKDHGKKLL